MFSSRLFLLFCIFISNGKSPFDHLTPVEVWGRLDSTRGLLLKTGRHGRIPVVFQTQHREILPSFINSSVIRKGTSSESIKAVKTPISHGIHKAVSIALTDGFVEFDSLQCLSFHSLSCYSIQAELAVSFQILFAFFFFFFLFTSFQVFFSFLLRGKREVI